VQTLKSKAAHRGNNKMTIKDIEKQFSANDKLVISRFLKLVNETAANDNNFSDEASLEQLNQFNELAEETDADIRANVLDWLRLKKTRLRGNQTDN
jgi:Fic family protein